MRRATRKHSVVTRKNYAVFRAPTMVISKKGTILAFAEGRVNGASDEDDMDVVLKRSMDGGKTWEKMQVLVNDGKNPCKNQSPVVLPSGRILLMYLWNP
jgi:sialidase-1